MMAKVAEILARALLKDIGEEERMRLDAAANHLGAQLIKFTSDASHLVGAIGNSFVRAIEQTENDYKRGSLLRLYRRRHSWKKADLARLQTYPLNKAARNLVSMLKASKRVGRGTAVAYQPIAERLVLLGRFLKEMYDPATSPQRRLYMLKQTKWFPEFVEMTYRGEYQKLKRNGGRSVSARAEQAVANAYCISTSTLKQLCSSVRKDAAAGFTMSRPIDVTDFEIWKKTGRFPSEGYHTNCAVTSYPGA
jgi:hypothetical protein